jgi:hypothetical protein
MSKWIRRASIALLATTVLGCSDILGPRHSDVDLARRTWLENHPQTYRFEVQTSSSWFTPTGFTRVQVSNGQVVSAIDPSGKPLSNYTTTIDSIWDSLLAAQGRHELNEVQFDDRGIPVELDFGSWPVDGGVHYSVRNFAEGT